jgi:beta-N-acetylhexosaminidase
MNRSNPSFSAKKHRGDKDELEDTAKLPVIEATATSSVLEKTQQPSIETKGMRKPGYIPENTSIEKSDTLELTSVHVGAPCEIEEISELINNVSSLADEEWGKHNATQSRYEQTLGPDNNSERAFIEAIDTNKLYTISAQNLFMAPGPSTPVPSGTLEDRMMSPIPTTPILPLTEDEAIETISTRELASVHSPAGDHYPMPQKPMSRGGAILLAALLLILVFNATALGSGQFIGAHGWAYILGGPVNINNPNLLNNIANQLRHQPRPGATTQATQSVTPQQYINLIVHGMTLDQKLGQMMIVQFTGPDYGLDISTMISQYNVGAVLIFSANNNIHDRNQLRNLITQMQHNSVPIPLSVAIDQEGGTVDRLISLDGARPSATSIGQTNDPAQATAEGILDAKDLSYYGINLNLAPVVDVTNIYNPQLYLRTFGNNPTLVTKMAAAYLKGLQQSGKVLGTLKHFPGLGDVGADPHNAVPYLTRSQSQLEAIDWAPYRSLIRQGNVHAIMVTHEIVTQIDSKNPSSLSYKLVTGILRNELGFQGVIMTDSLTMEGITAYYSEAQAAALAVEAGSDLLMGATSPRQVGNMIDGIKQAINNGSISMQRIDDSVRRILMMKYEMGLLHIPTS